MRAIAFYYKSPAASFTTLPQASTALSTTEFQGAIALFLGLADPRVVAEKAALGNPRFFRQAHLDRDFDDFGNSLSKYMGPNHSRTDFHNCIQDELHSLASTVGIRMRRTPVDLFTTCILPRNRQRYFMQTQEAQRLNNRACNGGVVPDLFDAGTGQMYDVKTTGFKEAEYYARQSVVDIKAATVPAQYARWAAAADEHFNETTAEVRPGPVETRLASMKQVVCISVGAFGEVNRATSALLNQIAEKGSQTPERFGCCHGQEQAKGVIAQWAMRRFGRVCLRGTVRVRHAALAAVVARAGAEAPPIRGGGRAEMPWNEWDSGNRAWVPGY
jgi:hypothetical protein